MPSPPVRTVGLRDLKNRLSEYVRMVRAGEHVQITDRGHVVAELIPPGAAPARRRPHPALADLEHRGLLRPGARNAADLYARPGRSPKVGRAKRLLDAVRAER